MSKRVKTLLAVLAAALMLFAVVMIALGQHLVAGVCFLTASLVIYVRETRA